MANYEDLSRRGLIKLGHDYDASSENALHNFLNGQLSTGSHYEEVRPVEQIIDRADEVAKKLEDKGSALANSIFDKMTNKLTEFVDGMADDIADGTDLVGEGEPDPEEA